MPQTLEQFTGEERRVRENESDKLIRLLERSPHVCGRRKSLGSLPRQTNPTVLSHGQAGQRSQGDQLGEQWQRIH